MPVTLTTARPVLKGKTSFSVFDQIIVIGIAKYKTKQPLFFAKNNKWTIAWGTNLLADKDAASVLPDNFSRQAVIDAKRILMDVQTVDCIIIANDLKELIEASFPENLWAEKKIEAGMAHYGKAATKPGECSLMMASGVTFMANVENHAALVAGGMLAGFQAGYLGQKNAFNTAHDAYTSAVSDAQEATDIKIAAYNAIYTKYMQMARVAKNLFRNDLAILNFIVFATIKHTIQPEYQAVETVRIKKNSSEQIANAIPGTPIINIGTLPVTINDTVILAAGATINNTFGERVKITNGNALYPCAVRMTRMVHKN